MRTLCGAVGLGVAWLVLAGSATAAQCAVGVLALACALTAARIALRQSVSRQVLAMRPAAFTAGALESLAQALADTGPVSACILRSVAGARAVGSTDEQPIGPAEFGRTPQAQHAAVITFQSFAPSSAVVGIDAHHRTLTIHTLPGGETS